jgi:Carboxypeptidase regulatory-like domain
VRASSVLSRSVGRARRRRAVLGTGVTLAFAAALLFPFEATAKKKPPATKTVSGKVLDTHNNGIANAVVTLTDLTNSKKIVMYSQQDGAFQFSGLSFDHDYDLRASYKGVSSEVRKVSSWDTRDRLVMYLHIPPPAEQ